MNCHYGREEPDGENMVLIAAVAGGHKQYIPIWAGVHFGVGVDHTIDYTNVLGLYVF